MLEGARIRNHAEALRLQLVDDVVELGLAEQVVRQALLEAHAEVVGDLRTLQVEVDQEHEGVHVLRQRQRQVDGGQRLALAHRHAGHGDAAPLVHVEAAQHARAQDLEGAQRGGVRDRGQHALPLHGAHVDAGVLEAARLLQVGRRRAHAAHALAQVRGLDGVGPLGVRSAPAARSAKLRRMASSMVVLIDVSLCVKVDQRNS